MKTSRIALHTGIALAAGIALVKPALAVVNIDYASVGNAGNANDAATGSLHGAVAYAYQIAKNETTITQHAELWPGVIRLGIGRGVRRCW